MKFRRIMSVLLLFAAAIALFFDRILLLISRLTVHASAGSPAQSVGIIGGADGPTVIFIADSAPNFIKYYISGAFALLSLLFLLLPKRDAKKQ